MMNYAYKVKMLYQDHVAYAEGHTDYEAVNRLLADSAVFREAPAHQVAVAMFRVYSNRLDLLYVTKLSKYRVDTD